MAIKKLKTQYNYDSIGEFSEGMAIVRLNNKYGYIDSKGKEVVPPIYDAAEKFRNGTAEVVFREQLRIIDLNGKVIQKMELIQKAKPIDTKIVVFKKVETFSKYEETQSLNNGFLKVRSGKKWGIADTSENEIVAPKYIEIKTFSHNYVRVKLKGKWGLIDMSGSEIISPKYNNIIKFGNDLAEVKSGRKWGLVDISGKEIVEPKYDEIGTTIDDCREIRIGSYWGLIDETGNEIVPPKYFNKSSLSKHSFGGFVDESGEKQQFEWD